MCLLLQGVPPSTACAEINVHSGDSYGTQLQPQSQPCGTGSGQYTCLVVSTLLTFSSSALHDNSYREKDVHGAKAVLRELLAVEYTCHDLQQVPDLVATVRKVVLCVTAVNVAPVLCKFIVPATVGSSLL